jgi:cellulose synthase/poly-beta-1,6-N-acetylglucosamine synthase-like glycosyltransferase
MFALLVSLFSSLFSIFLAVYLGYYALVRSYAKKPWDLNTDINYRPRLSILVPAHNEEKTIGQKLANIATISYPKNLFELIVVDDASTDRTLSIVQDFAKNNQEIDLKIVKQNLRSGKSIALNKALESSSNQIVVVSDADTIWEERILQKALPFLADPHIGAVTSVGLNDNEKDSWVTKGEDTYLSLVSVMRIGESKIYSTIRFEGGFCAYRRDAFDHFDCETGADDSGTALTIVQNGWRTVLVPDAIFYTSFPSDLLGKMRIKVRRASQLIGLSVKCFRLMVHRQLRLPKKIAIPQMLLFIINPIMLLALSGVALGTVVLYPFSFFSLTLLLFVIGSLLVAKRVFVEVLVDNLILLGALFSFLSGKRYIAWQND